MSLIKNAVSGLTVEEAIGRIETNTKNAALIVKEYLQTAGMDEYIGFLDTMYHYTSNTGDKAREAAAKVSKAELKDFFMHFVEEEEWHYKLARDDLKAFGLNPSAQKPRAVIEFDEFWASLKSQHDNAYLGALYVFENIVKYVAEDVKNFIGRLELTKQTSRWLAIHAEADLEHGEEVAEMVKKYIGDNPMAAIRASEEASRVWVNVMKTAFCHKKAA